MTTRAVSLSSRKSSTGWLSVVAVRPRSLAPRPRKSGRSVMATKLPRDVAIGLGDWRGGVVGDDRLADGYAVLGSDRVGDVGSEDGVGECLADLVENRPPVNGS